jgi:hypothetical protein
VMENGLSLIQRVAICFPAGVMGGLAAVFFSYVLFELGLSARFGVNAPITVKSPDIYSAGSHAWRGPAPSLTLVFPTLL